MSGIRMKLSIKDLEAKKVLDTTASRLEKPEKLLTECGLVLLRSIAKNFKAGGRPIRWKTSKRARAEGGQTLVKTARLKNSITMRVLGRVLTVGTNVVYAAIHNLGGRIRKNVTVKAHYRIVRKVFGRDIAPKRVLVRGHSRLMDLTMPRREYLLIQDEDFRVFQRIATDYVTS